MSLIMIMNDVDWSGLIDNDTLLRRDHDLNLFGCLSPQIIYNKNTNNYESVPCHNCSYCMNVKASKMSKRVKQEIKEHQFSVMFTLTYDNDHIPIMEAFKDRNGKMQLRAVGRTEMFGKSSPYNNKGITDYGYEFEDDLFIPTIENKKMSASDNFQFGYACKKDIQNFMKRLRDKIYKLNISDYDKKIRYFIASEYGPRTMRPHFHGILFFDSVQIASKIKDFIVTSWGKKYKTGRKFNDYTFVPFCDPFFTSKYVKFCDPNTAFYVAEYVSGNLRLPKVLRLRETKPFHLQSKNPVIGEFKADKQEVFALIDQGRIEKTEYVFDKHGVKKAVNIRVSEDTLRSMFRKCYRFNNLSYNSKYATYSFYSRHLSEWKEFINVQLIDYATKNNIDFTSVSLSNYLQSHSKDTFRNWCCSKYPEEYNKLGMDKNQNWYSSKNVYRLFKEIDFVRYSHYTDFTTLYLFMFDRYLFIYEQTKLRNFYDTFNQLIEKIGYYPAEFECFPMLKFAFPKHKILSKLQRNSDSKFENSRNELLKPYFDYILNTPLGQWCDPYSAQGIYTPEAFDKAGLNPRKSQEFETYKKMQKQRLEKRNKSKKCNNTKINGYRRMA